MEAAKARLARGYSRAARMYDALASHMYVQGIQQLLPLLRVPPWPTILDIGCGTGVNLFEAARWFAPTGRLCGIDISPGMVEVAREKAARLRLSAEFVVGDAETLPYADQSFDLIVCNSVYHWFRDRRSAVREMRRVLRPGGQVALICAAAPGFSEWFGLVDSVMQAVAGASAPTSRPELPHVAEVAGLMASEGFNLEHVKNPVHVQRVAEPEAFVRLMATIAPGWTADLSEENQTALERLLAAVIRQLWPTGFPNTWSAIEVVGTRMA